MATRGKINKALAWGMTYSQLQLSTYISRKYFMNNRFGKLCSLFVIFLQASAQSQPLPTQQLPETSTNQRTFKYVQLASDNNQISLEKVASSIILAWQNESKFGAFRDIRGEYSNPLFSAFNPNQAGLYWANVAGVAGSLKSNTIYISYFAGKDKTDGNRVLSGTHIKMTLSKASNETNTYELQLIGKPETRTASDLFVIKQPPLASPEEINDDISDVFRRIAPDIQSTATISGEISAQFLPPAIFANYERRFGAPAKVSNNGDLRSGVFQLRDVGTPNSQVAITIAPYRTGSKVEYKINVPYGIKSNGNPSIDQGNIIDIAKQVEKVAEL